MSELTLNKSECGGQITGKKLAIASGYIYNIFYSPLPLYSCCRTMLNKKTTRTTGHVWVLFFSKVWAIFQLLWDLKTANYLKLMHSSIFSHQPNELTLQGTRVYSYDGESSGITQNEQLMKQVEGVRMVTMTTASNSYTQTVVSYTTEGRKWYPDTRCTLLHRKSNISCLQFLLCFSHLSEVNVWSYNRLNLMWCFILSFVI